MFKSLKFKLSLPLFIPLLVLAILVNALVLRSFKQFYISSLVDQASREIVYNAAVIPDSLLKGTEQGALEPYCLFLDKYLRQRITFIDTSGLVLGDSRVAKDSLRFLENHKNRPEIQALFTSSALFAHEIRFSATLKMTMLYIAAPVIRNNALRGFLRFAIPLKDIEGYVRHRELAVLFLTLCAFAIFFLILFHYSSRIQLVVSEIGESARLVESGTSKEKAYFGFSTETDRLYDYLDETADRLQVLISDLVAQREEVRVLLQSVSEAVVAVDSRMTVMFANDNACRIFDSQYTSDTLPPMPLTGFTHLPVFREIASDSFTSKNRVERMVSFKGRAKDYELKAVCMPIFRRSDVTEGMAMLTLVDLTEEKRLAGAKAQFVEAASHELRTPLTVLKGYVETLEDCTDKALQNQCYEKIRHSVFRLENLTTDLLQLSYLESGKVTIKYDTINLEQLVGEIVNDLGLLLKEKDIAVAMACSGFIKSVPELVYIALYNLITNAIKYNKQGGRIIIQSALSPSQCEISVLDSGIGIANEYREKVFERFFRIDRHRSRETGGTGLGLAIVKHIANTLKGSVRVVDGIEGGAGFVLTLPLAPNGNNGR